MNLDCYHFVGSGSSMRAGSYEPWSRFLLWWLVVPLVMITACYSGVYSSKWDEGQAAGMGANRNPHPQG